jgi:hypothetical protein
VYHVAKVIINKDPRSVIDLSFCLLVEYILNSVQTDSDVSISSFGIGKKPFRNGISRPRASICSCWPDNERMERFTVCGDIFLQILRD